jgi:hypothetical protein
MSQLDTSLCHIQAIENYRTASEVCCGGRTRRSLEVESALASKRVIDYITCSAYIATSLHLPSQNIRKVIIYTAFESLKEP